MDVAFLNENTLGHASYLRPFVRELERRPELGGRPHVLDATPLPPVLQRRADFSIRGLRKIGLDFHVARWRRVVSRHVAAQLRELRARQRIEAVVVNTQSVALDLEPVARDLPLLVCLDATFRQLARTPWFAWNAGARALRPLTLAPILGRERRVLRAAARLLPWSAPVRDSLRTDYALPDERIRVLPPSLDPARLTGAPRPAHPIPQILFLGGDFRRKGGPLLLEAFRAHFRGRCELHVITQSPLAAEPGVFAHHGVTAGSDAWRERWRQADVFVFPSTLETFGIVLLEALAFGVPVIASRAGAAADILEEGRHGLLLPALTPDAIATAIRAVLDEPGAARARSATGRRRIEERYDLVTNTARLAQWLHEAGGHRDGNIEHGASNIER